MPVKQTSRPRRRDWWTVYTRWDTPGRSSFDRVVNKFPGVKHSVRTSAASTRIRMRANRKGGPSGFYSLPNEFSARRHGPSQRQLGAGEKKEPSHLNSATAGAVIQECIAVSRHRACNARETQYLSSKATPSSPYSLPDNT